MRYLILIAFVLTAGTTNAAGYKEQAAWNFLSPLQNQFRLNREVLRLQEEGGMFDSKDYYYITQMNTNIGNITNITGDDNHVDQDNSGDQAATNQVNSDDSGNLTIEGPGYVY